MRWREGRRSQNIEDLRGRGGGGGFGGGGGGMKLGIGSLVLLAAAYFLGVDPRMVMGLLDATQGTATQLPADGGPIAPPSDEGGDFISVVLADTEDTWSALFAAADSQYAPPRLRLFDQPVRTGCGPAM